MKKNVCMLLLICALALSSCGVSDKKLEAIEPIPPEEETQETIAPAMVTEEEPAPAPNAPIQEMVTYSVTLISYAKDEYCQQEPDLLLARCDYMVPHMVAATDDGTILEDDSTAAAFNAGFTDWDDGTNFAEIVAWAQESYAWNQENNVDHGIYNYADELECTIYQVGHLVNISGWYYSFTGGAHGNTWLMSWLFDTNTGVFISPLSLATDSQAFLDGVTQLLVSQSVDKAAEYDLLAEEMFWPDYRDVLADWPSYAVTFNQEGMSVGFSPYELAAYAAGPQVFTLSYGDLAAYCSEETIALLSGQGG